MSRLNLPIYERQRGIFDRLTTEYRYVGRAEGLHVFECKDDGSRQLYAKRADPPAGWHLRRGRYCYEFVRSAHGEIK